MAFRAPSEAPIGNALAKVAGNKFEHPPLVEALSTKRFAFPLTLNAANRIASHRMALLGDAAHRVHPLAGQGLNLGFSDVAFLSNTILKAKKGGQDIGDFDFVLSEYDKMSRMNANVLIASLEFVKNSYSPQVLGSEAAGHVLSGARNIGIDLI